MNVSVRGWPSVTHHWWTSEWLVSTAASSPTLVHVGASQGWWCYTSCPPPHHCQHYHHQDCKFEKEVCGYSFDEYITVNHSVSSFILLDMLVQISCHLELIEVCIYAVVSFLCYKYSDSYLCGLYYILFCLLRHCPRKAVLPTSPHHTIQQWKLWKNFTEFVYNIYLWFLCYKRFLLHIQNFSIYW